MSKVTASYSGIGEILRSGQVRADLTARAGRVAAAARARAPVLSGRYRASIHVEQNTTDRVAVSVVADTPYAVEVEFEVRVLGTALDAANG